MDCHLLPEFFGPVNAHLPFTTTECNNNVQRVQRVQRRNETSTKRNGSGGEEYMCAVGIVPADQAYEAEDPTLGHRTLMRLVSRRA